MENTGASQITNGDSSFKSQERRDAFIGKRYDCIDTSRLKYNDMIGYWQDVERRLNACSPTQADKKSDTSDDDDDWTKKIKGNCLISNVLTIEEKDLEKQEEEQIERIHELIKLLRTSEERFVQYGDRIERALLRMTQLKIFQLTTINDNVL